MAGPADESIAVDGGLPTKGDDAGVGTKDDSGLGTKDDSGLGTKDDSGLGTNDDGGTGMTGEDSGTTTEDSGSGTVDAGMPGGGMGACFACAEQRGCKLQVNACVASPACAEEGTCDQACFGSFGVVNPHCIQSCTTNLRATEDLLAAVTCGFRVCPRECLLPLISCGGDAGAAPMEPVDPGCPFAHLPGAPH
jgi:hypothetical protein